MPLLVGDPRSCNLADDSTVGKEGGAGLMTMALAAASDLVLLLPTPIIRQDFSDAPAPAIA